MTGVRLSESVKERSRERIRSLLESAVDHLVKCYRLAIDDGNEAPVVLVLIQGEMGSVGPVRYTIESTTMAHLETRAISNGLARAMADDIRFRWQAGCFPVLVFDHTGRHLVAYVEPGDTRK